MMTSPSELSFDCKPHIYSMLQKSFGEQTTEQTQNLEEFLARLEEERLKIDAFKRELPLCMQLLTNGNFLTHRFIFISIQIILSVKVGCMQNWIAKTSACTLLVIIIFFFFFSWNGYLTSNGGVKAAATIRKGKSNWGKTGTGTIHST